MNCEIALLRWRMQVLATALALPTEISAMDTLYCVRIISTYEVSREH